MSAAPVWPRTKSCGGLFPCIVILHKLSLLKKEIKEHKGRENERKELFRLKRTETVNYSKTKQPLGK